MTGIEICNSCCELVPQPKMIFYNGREPLKLSYADVQPSLAISKKIIENSRVCKNEYGFELEYVSTEKFIQSNRNLFPAEFDTEEGYMLEVGGGKVVIGSSTEKGRYYAVQTLAQLIGLNKNGSITGMTRRLVINEDMKGVYGEHVNSIGKYFLGKGIKPLIWADMLGNHPEVLDYVDDDIGLVFWNYDIPAKKKPYCMEMFVNRKRQLFGAGAARFGESSDLYVSL